MNHIHRIRSSIVDQLKDTDTLESLHDLRVRVFGKKGFLKQIIHRIGQASNEEKQSIGKTLNDLQKELEQLFYEKKRFLEQKTLNERFVKESLDITLDSPPIYSGFLHVITQVIDESRFLLENQGFTFVSGPDIEDDFHNFTALNMSVNHPARKMHDTFYIEGESGELLRTHTSSVQIRALEKNGAPLRIVSIGRAYRSDSDTTHTPMFHQLEILAVEQGIHLGHLKECAESFCREFFEIRDLPLRIRPSFFPFTSPSFEIDIGCKRTGEHFSIGTEDWLEIMGCGMVHPHVFSSCGIKNTNIQGFAFGVGIERLAMLKYGIDDVRDLFTGYIPFLNYYGFMPWGGAT